MVNGGRPDGRRRRRRSAVRVAWGWWRLGHRVRRRCSSGPTTTTSTRRRYRRRHGSGCDLRERRRDCLVSQPNDGGSPITSFTVTPYVGSAAQAPHTFTSSSTSQLVSGLTNAPRTPYGDCHQRSGFQFPVGSFTPGDTRRFVAENHQRWWQARTCSAGDQIIVTFPAPSPRSLCAAWNATSYPDLADPTWCARNAANVR